MKRPLFVALLLMLPIFESCAPPTVSSEDNETPIKSRQPNPVHEAIDAGLNHLLNCPTAKSDNPRNSKTILLDYEDAAWPDDYVPSVAGYQTRKTKHTLPHPEDLDTCPLYRLKYLDFDPEDLTYTLIFDIMISTSSSHPEDATTSSQTLLVVVRDKAGNWVITGAYP